MTDDGDAELRYLDAIERYRQGRCPVCNKGLGDARGLEYRRQPPDIYCHTCKKAWPAEIDPADLRDEIRKLLFEAAETSCSHSPEVEAPQMPIARTQVAVNGVRRFLRKIRLRR